MRIVIALIGTLVGVTATVFISWLNQRTLYKRELIREELRIRQTLYGEFITECAKLLIDALQNTMERPDAIIPVYALVNRIRLCASQAVLTEAERLTMHNTEQYFSINLTILELRDLARSGEADALRAFGEACRVELGSIQARL